MNRYQFEKLMNAARDIVRAAAAGQAGLDPLTISWASDLIAFNPFKLQPTPVLDKLLNYWQEDPMAGLSTDEIVGILNRPRPLVHGVLHKMLMDKAVFGLIDRGHSRYFCSEHARDAAMPAFECARAVRQLMKRKPLRIPRLAVKSELRPAQKKTKATKPPKPPKEPLMPKAKPTKTTKPKEIDLARKERTAFNPTDQLKKTKIAAPRRVTAPSGEAVNPNKVKPILCPSSLDTRFTPTLPPGGGEFSQQWRQLRGEA